MTPAPRLLHIVVSDAFAGVERYVCNVAVETAQRGWDVTVVGGKATLMRSALGNGVRWRPGSNVSAAALSVLQAGRFDVCHAQMTAAETVAVATRALHRAPILSTRHFAAPRGASRAGHLVAPWIASHLAREVAIGEFVAGRLERAPAVVLRSGVLPSPCLWSTENRVVLVLQRLEVEKDTATALRAWQLSGLAADGWSLRVVGGGSQQSELERLAAAEAIGAVTFAGWTTDVSSELRGAGMLLASAPAEPLGLAVLEAMAAGVPVVACGAGGHLETVGRMPDAALFPPRDAAAAAGALRSLCSDELRARMSAEGRRIVAEHFTIDRHVDRLLVEYEAVRRPDCLSR